MYTLLLCPRVWFSLRHCLTLLLNLFRSVKVFRSTGKVFQICGPCTANAVFLKEVLHLAGLQSPLPPFRVNVRFHPAYSNKNGNVVVWSLPQTGLLCLPFNIDISPFQMNDFKSKERLILTSKGITNYKHLNRSHASHGHNPTNLLQPLIPCASLIFSEFQL